MLETKYVVGRLEILVSSELFDLKIDSKFIRNGFFKLNTEIQSANYGIQELVIKLINLGEYIKSIV